MADPQSGRLAVMSNLGNGSISQRLENRNERRGEPADDWYHDSLVVDDGDPKRGEIFPSLRHGPTEIPSTTWKEHVAHRGPAIYAKSGLPVSHSLTASSASEHSFLARPPSRATDWD